MTEQRTDLTLRLWRGGSKRQFERYITQLLKLAASHEGRSERRAADVSGGPGCPDAVLVISFPDTAAVDAYLSDPHRDDLEELAAKSVLRSLITGGRRHDVITNSNAEVTTLPVNSH